MWIQALRALGRLGALALLASCVAADRMEPLPTPDRSAIPPSGPTVVEGRFVAGPPLPGLRFAPSEGTCAPKAIAGMATACCAGNPCNGHCVLGDDGRVGCSCYGQAGGCPAGQSCSKLSNRCVLGEDRKPMAQ
jgi:hypothetical protein